MGHARRDATVGLALDMVKPGRRGSRIGAVAAIVAALVASTVAAQGVERSAVDRGAAIVRAIAPGVTYTRIRDPRREVVMHVVRVDPSQASTVDVAASGLAMGRYSRPSRIGRAHRALVAINGDFGLRSGRPIHPFLMDGTLMTRGAQTGASFAVTSDEDAGFVDRRRPSVSGLHLASSRAFAVTRWNSGDPGRDEIAAYTRYGGDIEAPPRDACAARLRPDGPLRWARRGVGVSQRYVVEAGLCRWKPIEIEPKTIVLASKRWGDGADTIEAMRWRDAVKLRWSSGRRHVADSIGGMPDLVDGGINVARRCGARLCQRHPRTGVGFRRDGDVLLVVVDGRSRVSQGMTLRGFAQAFLRLGAVEALNLDGGGSAAMWIAGRGIVSRPSDSSGERAVVNAVLVLPDADPGELVTARRSAPALRGIDASTAAALAARDPGSTGGLADALVRGAFGGRAPAWAERIAGRFRASHRG